MIGECPRFKPSIARFQSADKRPQGFNFIHEVKRQGNAGEINVQVSLQAHGNMGFLQAGARKTPVGRIAAGRFENAFIHQLHDPFPVLATGTAEIAQRKLGLFVQHDSTQQFSLHGGLHFHFAARVECQLLLHLAVEIPGLITVG